MDFMLRFIIVSLFSQKTAKVLPVIPEYVKYAIVNFADTVNIKE